MYNIKDGNTVLHNAVFYGHIDLVNIILADNRCDINAKDKVSDNMLLHVTN